MVGLGGCGEGSEGVGEWMVGLGRCGARQSQCAALEGRVPSKVVPAVFCWCSALSDAEREDLDAKWIQHGTKKKGVQNSNICQGISQNPPWETGAKQ